MKVLEESSQRLELGGMPHQGFVLLGGAVVCPILCLGTAGMAWKESHVRGAMTISWALLPLCVVLLFGVGMWVMCGVLALRRERLVLDRVTGKGEHWTGWLWSGRRVPSESERASNSKKFQLSDIRHVTLEFYLASSGGGKGLPSERVRARLLLSKPRRAIVLEDSQSGYKGPVEALATRVAAWLGMELVRRGEKDTKEGL